LFVGGSSAIVNLLVFVAVHNAGVNVSVAAVTAFIIAALVNYFLSIKLIFRHNAKWRTPSELLVYFLLVSLICVVDMYCTLGFVSLGSPPLAGQSWRDGDRTAAELHGSALHHISGSTEPRLEASRSKVSRRGYEVVREEFRTD
jgi:putative flippase GtrA